MEKEKTKPDNAAMDTVKKYISMRIASSLYVTKKEKDGLRTMGYDPEKLLCIDRSQQETVFIEMKISGPICLDKAHGGGGYVRQKSRYEEQARAFLED